MSKLIDALKGLLEDMSMDEQEVDPFAYRLSEIIAEHERSGTDERTRIEHERGAEPVKLIYQPSDRQVQDLLLALSDNAVDHDPEEYGLPCFETDRGTFYDPCSLVELVRQQMSNWREAAE